MIKDVITAVGFAILFVLMGAMFWAEATSEPEPDEMDCEARGQAYPCDLVYDENGHRVIREGLRR